MRKLVGMMLLITLLTHVYPVYASGSIQTSYFTIEDSLLEYFKVDIREQRTPGHTLPVVVEAESKMLNLYFKLSVYRYADDVTFGGFPIPQLIESAKTSDAFTTSQNRAKAICNYNYNGALVYSGMDKYSSIISAAATYRYFGGKDHLVLYADLPDIGMSFATYYNTTQNLGYTFLIGKVNEKKSSSLDNAALLTILMQYMTEVDEFPDYSASAQYITITKSNANIRATANGNGKKIATGKQGNAYLLLGEEGSWYMINVNGQTGFVHKNHASLRQ